MPPKVKINHAQYDRVVDDKGNELEAVVRMQETQYERECFKEDCPLGGRILPMQKYARVYYADDDKVEVFHVACFVKEFQSAFSRF